MAALILFVGIVGLFEVIKLSTHITDLVTDNIPSLDGIGKFNEGQTRIDSLQRVLLNPYITAEQRRATLIEIESTWQRINEGFKQYDAAAKKGNEDEIYTKFKLDWNQWQKSHTLFMQMEEKYYSLGVSNPLEKALELTKEGNANSPEMASIQKALEAYKQLSEYSIKEGNTVFESSDKQVFALLKFNQDEAISIRQGSAQDVLIAILLMIVGVVASLIIAMLLGIIIYRQITGQIFQIVGLAEEISTGNLKTEIKTNSNSKNEIDRLMISFQYMTDNLSNLIRKIQESGIQVTSSSTQIAAAGKQLEASVTEQLASTNEINATTKEISSTSRELMRTVEEVAVISQGTTAAASGSQQDLLQMESTIKQLGEATNSIASKLEIIRKKASNINNIVVTITKVADRANLLSLNAAIEAEKAGDYGLGFAVVAREIRRLADQTAIATIDIEEMVKQMQLSVSTGVMEMDKFAAEVGRGVKDVANISGKVGHIIEQVQELSPRYTAVNQGMELQYQGAAQISESMSQLANNSGQTVASLREINHAISQLNQVAQGLQQEMDKFKVS